MGDQGAATSPRWVAASGGAVPEGAEPLGADDAGAPLWLARAWIDGGLHLGQVDSGRAGARVVVGDAQVVVPEYQVLVEGGEWMHGTTSSILPGAVPCGHEVDGLALFAARARIPGHGTRLGSFGLGRRGAYVTLEETVRFAPSYETLVLPVSPSPSADGAALPAASDQEGHEDQDEDQDEDEDEDEEALVVRVHSGDASAWQEFEAQMRVGGTEFGLPEFRLPVVDAPECEGLPTARVAGTLRRTRRLDYFFVFDATAARRADHAVLAIDATREGAGAAFRVSADTVFLVDANLGTANMDFSEYAALAAERPDGVLHRPDLG